MLLVLKKVISVLMAPAYKTRFEDGLYDITYTIRPKLDFDNPDPKETIDGFYLAEAKAAIDRWFDGKINGKIPVNLDGFSNFLFSGIEKQVKFIWYEISPDSTDLSSINVFNRLNKGKIGLTSSELIKALFVLDLENDGDPNGTASGQLVMSGSSRTTTSGISSAMKTGRCKQESTSSSISLHERMTVRIPTIRTGYFRIFSTIAMRPRVQRSCSNPSGNPSRSLI